MKIHGFILIFAGLLGLLSACGGGGIEGRTSERVNLGECLPGPSPGSENFSLQGIVGGTYVKPSDPFSKRVVMILSKDGDTLDACTGTPITRDVILTAAHCVKNLERNYEVQVAFELDATCASGFQRRNLVRAEDVVAYENFKGLNSASGDIALIKLPAPIPRNYLVTPLVNAGEKTDRNDLIFAGYGVSSNQGQDSLYLRKVVKDLKASYLVHQGERAEFDQGDRKGICSGDSGGPAFVHVQGRYKVLAVNATVSARIINGKETLRCEDGKSVAMYIPFYRGWIDEKLKAWGEEL